MEGPTPGSPTPQKRPLEEDTEPPVTTPVKAIRSEASSPLSVLSHVQTPSPSKSTAPKSTAPDSNHDAFSSQTVPASNTPQPAKRRKLTQQEKDDQRLEKEAKAKARADKKAQKEAEDKLKAEQKAQREEEKRKKMEEREEKKRQKEEEQQQKEEDKAKKERAQMKLNAFFVKPKVPGISAGQAVVDSTQNHIAPLVSLASDAPGDSTNSVPPSPQKAIVKNAQSDYERYFLPFNLAPHVILAPKNAFFEDPVKLETAQRRLDDLIAQEDVHMEPITLKNFKSSFPALTSRGRPTASIIEVIECVNGSTDHPIDLTNDKDIASQQPLDLLKDIPMKYIHFGEDVRPPYYGTYTRSYTDAEAARLARNPLARLRQDTNYDYDSEAEWDEPEEGEDLDSDGEDDVDEEEDDMDGFLDDEEDPQLKRRLISGDLVPVSTGLCWEDADKVSKVNDGSGAICSDFNNFKMGFLLDSQLRSIDPFSTAYWMPEATPSAGTLQTTSKDTPINAPMNPPPRAPLAQRTMNGLLNTLNAPSNPLSSTTSKPAKAKRLIPAEQLPAFKAEIEGKDLTKIGMIEALKKVFPKLPKDAITNTLSVVAARVGPTEKEKRWVLINS
ncbi:Nn.00g082850.m01.CDS01 [Neocucurbitaria sp. VM-36]